MLQKPRLRSSVGLLPAAFAEVRQFFISLKDNGLDTRCKTRLYCLRPCAGCGGRNRASGAHAGGCCTLQIFPWGDRAPRPVSSSDHRPRLPHPGVSQGSLQPWSCWAQAQPRRQQRRDGSGDIRRSHARRCCARDGSRTHRTSSQAGGGAAHFIGGAAAET